jgi:hypothetical protein
MNLDQGNNWIVFASKVWPDFSFEDARIFEQNGKMDKVLSEWGVQGDSTIASLIQILQDLKRQDVLVRLYEKYPHFIL